MSDKYQARRRSFNENADNYRLARPAYPPEVFDLLVERCGLAPGCQVLEVGAGSGLATRDLLARGAAVLAVEPGRELAAHLTAELDSDRLAVLVSDVETAPLPDQRFDLAASATAFHWVDTQVALPRIARSLRPRGWLAVWWHIFGDPEQPTPFRVELTELYEAHLPEEARDPATVPPALQIAERTEELEHGGWFEVTDMRAIRWNHQLTSAAARKLFATFPNIAELDETRRVDFLDRIANLIETRFDGQVTDPYVTAVYLARKRGG